MDLGAYYETEQSDWIGRPPRWEHRVCCEDVFEYPLSELYWQSEKSRSRQSLRTPPDCRNIAPPELLVTVWYHFHIANEWLAAVREIELRCRFLDVTMADRGCRMNCLLMSKHQTMTREVTSSRRSSLHGSFCISIPSPRLAV